MTLEGAIGFFEHMEKVTLHKKYDEAANMSEAYKFNKAAMLYKQFADWLRELKMYKEVYK
jgi:hypothetical protein